MRIGVVTFPGSLDDRDAQRAVREAGGQAVALWHGDSSINNVDAVILPGGFSYGDYLRCGAISRFAPVMTDVIEKAKAGLPVLGICNGFQILCEAGLVPGALLHNVSHKFICKNVFIKPVHTESAITAQLVVNQAYKIPIAHGEGNFFADEKTMKKMSDNKQILFQYCDVSGNVTEAANPNGSLKNIAGICNATRNVFGMMPHPERAAENALANTDGFHLFSSLQYFLSKLQFVLPRLQYSYYTQQFQYL